MRSIYKIKSSFLFIVAIGTLFCILSCQSDKKPNFGWPKRYADESMNLFAGILSDEIVEKEEIKNLKLRELLMINSVINSDHLNKWSWLKGNYLERINPVIEMVKEHYYLRDGNYQKQLVDELIKLVNEKKVSDDETLWTNFFNDFFISNSIPIWMRVDSIHPINFLKKCKNEKVRLNTAKEVFTLLSLNEKKKFLEYLINDKNHEIKSFAEQKSNELNSKNTH